MKGGRLDAEAERLKREVKAIVRNRGAKAERLEQEVKHILVAGPQQRRGPFDYLITDTRVMAKWDRVNRLRAEVKRILGR